MINLKQYLVDLKFDYAATYSGLRGPLYDDFRIKINEQITLEERKLEKARYIEEQRIKKNIAHLKFTNNPFTTKIIDLNGQQHESATLIAQLKNDDVILNQIFDTLSLKYESHAAWMCAPVFRDSIVFYKEEIIIGLIHICFSCESIVNEEGEPFYVDAKIYPKLMKQLIDLGHKINDSDDLQV